MTDRFFQRRDPSYVRAIQWNKHGDHVNVQKGPMIVFVGIGIANGALEPKFGKVELPEEQGWLTNNEGNSQIVELGDWLVRIKDEYVLFKKAVFESLFLELDTVDADIIEKGSET